MAHWLRQPGAMRSETVFMPLDKIEPTAISCLHTVAAEALEGDPEADDVIMGYIDQALEHVLHKVGRFVGASTHFSRNTTPPVWALSLKTILVTRLFAMCQGNFDPPKHPRFIAIESLVQYMWTFANDRLSAREEELAA